jgi:hypothetical protein
LPFAKAILIAKEGNVSMKKALPAVVMLLGALATVAGATTYYYVKDNGNVPGALDSAFVCWEAYQVNVDSEPTAPTGFTKQDSIWFPNHNSSTPRQIRDQALSQSYIDQHSATGWAWESFIRTFPVGQQWRFAEPGSCTNRTFLWAGAVGQSSVTTYGVEPDTTTLITAPYFHIYGHYIYFASKIVYPYDMTYTWNQTGTHDIGSGSQTSHYTLQY